MAVALSEFARYVRPDVAGCPEPMVLDAILRAGIEFCKRVVSAREVITVNVLANVTRYPLVSTGNYVDRIVTLTPSDLRDMFQASQDNFDSCNYDEINGTPKYYFLDNAQNLVIGYKPEATETMKATVRIIPKENATALPDFLGQRYKLQIADGAKSILMMQSDKPWSDPNLAAVSGARFERAIVDENVRFFRGNGRKQSYVEGQYF